jgi:hypothetical protein
MYSDDPDVLRSDLDRLYSSIERDENLDREYCDEQAKLFARIDEITEARAAVRATIEDAQMHFDSIQTKLLELGG